MTHSAVMRSNSVYKADLCNLCDFTFQQILILRNGGGKSVKDKTQFGKVMQHKVAEMCPIGASGLWLLVRFEVMKEQETFDF